MDDLAHQLLLAHLTGQTSGPGGMADVVAQLAGDDPQAQQLVAALRQRESFTAAAPDNEDDGIDGLDPLDYVIDGEARPAPEDPEIADLLTRLYDEVEVLRAHSDRLADALGACRRCFGDDERCPVCHGRGSPGGRAPDSTLFAEIVVPAHARGSALAPEDDRSKIPTRRATHAIR